MEPGKFILALSVVQHNCAQSMKFHSIENREVPHSTHIELSMQPSEVLDLHRTTWMALENLVLVGKWRSNMSRIA